MSQFFICNQDNIDLKLQELIKTGTSNDGWTDFYFDKILKEEWHLTRYHSEYLGGGTPVLKRIPVPTTEQLISIVMTATDKSDIIGASLELSEKEQFHQEDYRSQLILQLLNADIPRLTDFEKERIKIIICESELLAATNRKKIVGKHYTEITKDADYYRKISEQANAILKSIEKYSS